MWEFVLLQRFSGDNYIFFIICVSVYTACSIDQFNNTVSIHIMHQHK